MGVDWRLLQNQKMRLLEITEGDDNVLMGLVNFIEALQDAAIDEGIATSEEVVLMADHTKLGRKASFLLQRFGRRWN
jgi:hypothetical protein